MIEYLRMLKDGVRHMSYGDPYDGPTVRASDVVQWAIDEIASLLAAGDRLESQLCEAAKERDRLRLAIRRLAEQDATLSLLCKRDGSQVVTVTIDGTLTDAEREALHHAVGDVADLTGPVEDTLRGLLERMK